MLTFLAVDTFLEGGAWVGLLLLVCAGLYLALGLVSSVVWFFTRFGALVAVVVLAVVLCQSLRVPLPTLSAVARTVRAPTWATPWIASLWTSIVGPRTSPSPPGSSSTSRRRRRRSRTKRPRRELR